MFRSDRTQLDCAHLAIWDHAQAARPTRRACVLAWGFGAAEGLAQAEALPIGMRDAALMQAQRDAFGPGLDLVAPCPSCAETAAFSVDLDLMLAQKPQSSWPLRLICDGLVLTCARPSTADLAAAWAGAPSLADARRRLFETCVDVRDGNGTPVAHEGVEESVIAAASLALGAADPLADIRFSLTCPSCSTPWEVLFDPARVFWRHFDAWARAGFQDVQILARAYGWSERDILSMHPARRRLYLEAAA